MCRILTVHKVRTTGESLMPQFLRMRLHFQEEVALRNTHEEYSIPGSPFDLEGGSFYLFTRITKITLTLSPINIKDHMTSYVRWHYNQFNPYFKGIYTCLAASEKSRVRSTGVTTTKYSIWLLKPIIRWGTLGGPPTSSNNNPMVA